MTKKQLVICPYCGETQPAGDRCRSCRGLFEPLSRQATHNAMGPWFIHDRTRPHQPGCSYETLVKLIERGQVTKTSIIRGPTSKQFWTIAKRVAGAAHLLGYCHACDTRVDPRDHGCPECGVPFGAFLDRNHLGLPEIRPLPGEAPETGTSREGPTWIPPAMTHRGISSFAADEELLAETPLDDDPDAPSGLAELVSSDAEPAGTNGAEELHSPVVRSMRRQIERQRRTIRTLTVLVVLVAVIAAVVNLSLRSSHGRADRPTLEAPRPSPPAAAAPPPGEDAGDRAD